MWRSEILKPRQKNRIPKSNFVGLLLVKAQNICRNNFKMLGVLACYRTKRSANAFWEVHNNLAFLAKTNHTPNLVK